MAKKSKRRRSRPIEGAGRSEPTASPASNSGEVATVAWMLSLLATLIAEVLGILIRLLMLQRGSPIACRSSREPCCWLPYWPAC